VSGHRDHWADWVLQRRCGGDPECLEQGLSELYPIRDRVLANARLAQGEVLLDVGAGDGLIGFGALSAVGERGRVIFSDVSEELVETCRTLAAELGELKRCGFLTAAATDLSALGDSSVDAVTTRSVLIYITEKPRALAEFHRVLKPGGRLSMFEPINSFRFPPPRNLFWGYDVTAVQDLAERVLKAYEEASPAATNPMLDFDERDLLKMIEDSGFGETHLAYEVDLEPRPVMGAASWETFAGMSGNPLEPTVQEAMGAALTPAEARRFADHLRPLVERGEGRRARARAYAWALK
jgi:ubiquinone/menaquinone biosynthesis C-methylase UbiE